MYEIFGRSLERYYNNDFIIDNIAEIPEGVEEISNGAFSGASIEKVVFPSTLKRIGIDAFSDCSVSSVDFGKSLVEYIGDEAFAGNSKEYVKLIGSIPESLKYAGKNCFARLDPGQSVRIPASIEFAGQSAFNMKSVRSIIVDKSAIDKNNGLFASFIPAAPCRNASEQTLHVLSGGRRAYSLQIYRQESIEYLKKMAKFCVDGRGFNIDAYDRCFRFMKHLRNRNSAAFYRLEHPEGLSRANKKMYADFINQNFASHVNRLKNDLPVMIALEEAGVITYQLLEKMIIIARQSKNPDMLSHLAQYKEEHFPLS
ncbi:MAG: leucine-rich repeat domain-containing protein [Clostridiales bacterium]|nr:leucine-rich repeat domain-containing protein [Clostridiales bacterium]